MTQNVVNSTLNPRTIRLAEAYFDLEDDLEHARRKSVLMMPMVESLRDRVLAELKASRENPAVLRDTREGFEALEDVLGELRSAVDRMDRAYYAADTAEAAQ